MSLSPPFIGHEPGENGHREQEVTARHDERDDQAERAPDFLRPWTVDAHGLEGAPRSVVQVETQGDHAYHVEDRHRDRLETGDEVVVGVTGHEIRVQSTRRQVQQVIRDEQKQEDSAPAHHARGGVDVQRLFLLVLRPTRGPALSRQRPGGPHVDHECKDQDGAEDPQEPPVRKEGISELSEPFGVVVEHLGSHEHLEVPEPVGHHEQHEDATRDGHRDLLADRGAIQGRNPAHVVSSEQVARVGQGKLYGAVTGNKRTRRTDR